MDECYSIMSAGCIVSLYRSWTVQISLVPCWEEAVDNCTLKQNKDHWLEDTRLPLLGERMLLQIPVVQTSGPCLEVYNLGTKPKHSTCRLTNSTHVPRLISYSGVCISQSIYAQPMKNMNRQIHYIQGELSLCTSELANFDPQEGHIMR